jgi:hypothetical protein
MCSLIRDAHDGAGAGAHLQHAEIIGAERKANRHPKTTMTAAGSSGPLSPRYLSLPLSPLVASDEKNEKEGRCCHEFPLCQQKSLCLQFPPFFSARQSARSSA